MKSFALVILTVALFMFATNAKADSADEYNAGYNAAIQSYPPPGTYQSEDYRAGWEAGKVVIEQRQEQSAPPTEEPQDQSSSDTQE